MQKLERQPDSNCKLKTGREYLNKQCASVQAAVNASKHVHRINLKVTEVSDRPANYYLRQRSKVKDL